MTTRQQIARLLPVALLLVLVIVGLRGTVPLPRWNGPLKADGLVIGFALEAVFGASLAVVLARDRAARRAADAQPYHPAAADADIEPAQALRFTLKYVLSACLAGVAIVMLSDLHLHFFDPGRTPPPRLPSLNTGRRHQTLPGGGGGSLHFPLGPVLYALLVIAIVTALVVSVWWARRLRLPAPPLVIADTGAEELREAVAEGRAALDQIDDARAAIIACYLAMERSLADRGTARAAADTPDELLARAVAAGTVRGAAASRLTSLFYEARFSSHPLGDGMRDAARSALDELAGELRVKPPAEPAAPGGDRA